jgi:hypothetical protein
MSPKKDGKRTVRLSAVEEGDLPAANGDEPDDEVGRVEREADVFSEPPEIDTTRADLPPRRNRLCIWCGILCSVSVLALGVTVLAIIVVFYGRAGCGPDSLVRMIRNANVTSVDDLVQDAATVFHRCAHT